MTSKAKFEPIESAERLYVKVARRVEEMIASRQILPGEKLPSERHLAEMLKVSRPTIREAMIALEVSGLIDVRTGSGIYVVDNPESTDSQRPLTDEGIGPFEILEMRLLIEPEACALAADRMTPTQLAEIKAIYEQMEQAERTPDMEEVDLRFHTAIGRATENTAIASAISWLWALRAHSVLSKGFHRLIRDEGVYPVLNEHAAIVAALEARDPEASREAMRAHLQAATDAAAEHFRTDTLV